MIFLVLFFSHIVHGVPVGPSITSISPSSLLPSTDVTVVGSGFGSNPALVSVKVHGLDCLPLILNSDTSLSCTLPVILPGTFSIYVLVDVDVSNFFPITIAAPPGFTSPRLMDQLGLHTGIFLGKTAVFWGGNGDGQLGLGHQHTIGDELTDFPLIATNLGNNEIQWMGGNEVHSCVLFLNGNASCFGHNGNGQLGDGTTTRIGDQPGQMPPPFIHLGGGASLLGVGGAHSCAWLVSSILKCWGENSAGQLGLGDTSTRLLPETVNIGSDLVAQLSLGWQHTCIKNTDGSVVKCWGAGFMGQLGNGGLDNIGDDEGIDSLPAIFLGENALQFSVSASAGHGCVVLASNTLKCWGFASFGQLGLGDPALLPSAVYCFLGPPYQCVLSPETVDLGTPIPVPIFSLVCGILYTCVVLAIGEVRCWGANDNGILGIGTNISPMFSAASALPVDLGPGVSAVQLVSAGHNCVLLNTAETKCWGSNFEGQLGIGNTNNIGDVSGEMPPASSFIPPLLMSASPSSVLSGSTLTLIGANFGPVSSAISVSFGGLNCPISSFSTFKIECTVPALSSGGPKSVTVSRTPAQFGASNALGITYVFVPCESLMTGTTTPQFIQSSGSIYANNLNCTWVISTTSSCAISLTLTTLNIAPGDSLSIFNGPTIKDGRILWRHSGGLPSVTNFRSSRSTMTVQFMSDSSGGAAGFVASFVRSCDLPATRTVYAGEPIPQNAKNATLTIVGAGNDPNNFAWGWVFNPSGGCVAELKITSFNTAAGDTLSVFNAFQASSTSPLIKRGILMNERSGNLTATLPITLTGNADLMLISWKGSAANTQSNFIATVSSRCPAPSPPTYYLQDQIPAGATSFTLQAVASGAYPASFSWRWTINPTKAGCGIRLTLNSFNIELNGDVFNIFNGASNTTGRMLSEWSGAALPTPSKFRSTGPMLVEFSSNSNTILGSGFVATVIQVCTTISPPIFYAGNAVVPATSNATFIVKVVEAGFYPNNLVFGWSRTSPSGCWQVTFSMFKTEATVDLVSIHNGTSSTAPVLLVAHGNATLPPVTKSGRSLFIRFTSNSANRFEGFTASVANVAC